MRFLQKNRRIMISLGILLVVVASFSAGLRFTEAQHAAQEEVISKYERSTIGVLRKIRDLSSGSRDFADYLPIYNRLREVGFLDEPDVAAAEDIMSRLVLDYQLNNLFYRINPKEEHNIQIDKDFTAVLNDIPIILEIEAIADQDIYQFLDALVKAIPGLVMIREVKASRINEMSIDQASTMILDGNRPSLVRMQVTLDWLSLTLPDFDTMDEEEENAS